VPVALPVTPEAWGDAVRGLYRLTATEQELVALAESALALARDGALKPAERLMATARFQALVKQLHLEESDGQTERQPAPWPAAG
jgi:hypothetical protein